MHYYKIDANGNIIMGSDTATTAATHFTKILVALLHTAGFAVEADPSSQVSNIAYDRTAHRLEWDDANESGRQSVEIQNPALMSFLDDAFSFEGDRSNLVDVLANMEDRIKYHVTTQHVATRDELMHHGFTPISTTLNAVDSKLGSATEPGSLVNEVHETVEMARTNATMVNTIHNVVTLIIDQKIPMLLDAVLHAPTTLLDRLRRIEGVISWAVLPRTPIKQEVRGLMRFLSAFSTRDEKWTGSDHLPRLIVGEAKKNYTNPPSAKYPFVLFGKKSTLLDESDATDKGPAND